jgi:hypothetical protein
MILCHHLWQLEWQIFANPFEPPHQNEEAEVSLEEETTRQQTGLE